MPNVPTKLLLDPLHLMSLGFVLFRVFDIVKPWPVNMADTKLEGGMGIMFDDVLAGLYAMACLQLLLLFVRNTGDTH